MRPAHTLAILALALLLALAFVQPASAARHHFYVGTITNISANSLTIHSKTHAADYHFVINGQTRFLRRGQATPRSAFKRGTYVTVSYSPGPNNSMIAWHISIRR
ncbi:MAG: hypothetical protein JWO42_1933 [Chloroflexi bacterium]|jgi:hypothetical protein|nr:hypothetical protein [Chloroflexota bacterium]